MMCMKDMLCEAKDKIAESKDVVVDKSIDMRMALAKKGELDDPIKSFSIHKSCSTPLWKIALWILGISVVMIMLFKIKKRVPTRDDVRPDL